MQILDLIIPIVILFLGLKLLKKSIKILAIIGAGAYFLFCTSYGQNILQVITTKVVFI